MSKKFSRAGMGKGRNDSKNINGDDSNLVSLFFSFKNYIIAFVNIFEWSSSKYNIPSKAFWPFSDYQKVKVTGQLVLGN